MSKANHAVLYPIQATTTVSEGMSRYGTVEPQVCLRFPPGTGPREIKAALHRLAADVELATPRGEGWGVQIESYYDAVGRVYLELANATPAEVERGMAFLRNLVG